MNEVEVTMKRKTVTVCGSFRFWEKIQECAERLELEQGYVVLNVIGHVLDRELTEEDKKLLGELHLAKIEISDAIFVVNEGGYMGEAVKREVEYAKALGKEIMYLEQ